MTIIALIISIAALAVAIVALIKSNRPQVETKTVVEKETVKVEHAPSEHPFDYDETTKTYRLDGSLAVKGDVSALGTIK